MTVSRRVVLGGSLAVAAASGVTLPAEATRKLVNLAHLDYLREPVAVEAVAEHSTYGSGPLGVLWTYADRRADGSYARIGGGPYDPATNTYSQGAYNADDIARAAVVYLRHYSAHRDQHSRDAAYGLLRGLTYLQTTTGPNAGNVVLWMQPDGTLNPSAEPVELPDPSDSGPSYWLARTVWALGEGYAVFRRVDPAFAAFLRGRLELALRALERQVLVRYGQWNVVDGRRVPAWLIVSGADATSEAVLGLAARLQGLLRVGAAADRPGLRQVAAFVAAWYFGANRAGEVMYDAATGRTYDGISGDGVVNRNSGAESTIHGLLSMLALDASLAARARRLGAARMSRSGLEVVEAESGELSGGAAVVTPPSAWTGESQWSGGAYVSLPPGSTVSLEVPDSSEERLVLPVVDLVAERNAGRSTWTGGPAAEAMRLGTIAHGGIGAQGVSSAPGALLPVTLARSLSAGAARLTATSTGNDVRVDAVLLIPLVSSLRLGDTWLLVNLDARPRTAPVDRGVAYAYTSDGVLRSRRPAKGHVEVLPGGFTVVLG